MANLRQSIIIRTDLGFPVGLLTAQIAHAHMEFIRKRLIDGKELTFDEKEWLKSPYLFVHEAKNQETLLHYMEEAEKQKVHCEGWRDTVYIKMSDTQMRAFPDVLVAASFGPTDSDRIKAVIGDLPLLK